MPLSDTALRLAKPKGRACKLADGRDLCLLSGPTALAGGAIGTNTVARNRRDAARRQLAIGVNPSAQRKTEKAANQHTFESVARHWLAQQVRYVHKRKRALSYSLPSITRLAKCTRVGRPRPPSVKLL